MPATQLRRGVAIAIAFALPLALLTVALVAGRDTDETVATQRYVAAIEPLARNGGRIVIEGLRAGIGDLQRGDDADLPRRSVAWERELGAVRDDWAALVPPGGLRAAHRRFLAAFDGYLDAAADFHEATLAEGNRRERLLRATIDGGEASDAVWDEAAAATQARLRELGLPTVTWLPS